MEKIMFLSLNIKHKPRFSPKLIHSLQIVTLIDFIGFRYIGVILDPNLKNDNDNNLSKTIKNMKQIWHFLPVDAWHLVLHVMGRREDQALNPLSLCSNKYRNYGFFKKGDSVPSLQDTGEMMCV